MSAPSGFSWEQHKNGDVVITHHGRVASILRNRKALDFVEEVGLDDDQALMARLTGNYKRGNERRARSHRRNR